MNNGETAEDERGKYKVDNPNKLKSWEMIARREILKWLDSEEYREEIMKTTLSKDENQPGPFTCFLYHFAYMCQCRWGVMVDFSERNQRIFLTDHYYKWMHKLRDELNTVDTELSKSNPPGE